MTAYVAMALANFKDGAERTEGVYESLEGAKAACLCDGEIAWTRNGNVWTGTVSGEASWQIESRQVQS